MKNIENKNVLKEKLVNEFLDKYFFNQDQEETIEISRNEINKLVKAGESLEELLYKTGDRGYVFHGSPYNIRELKPSKGECMSEKEINKLIAIYAVNQPSIAIFHAIMPRSKIKGKFIRKWTGHTHIDNGKRTFNLIFEMNKLAYEDFLKNPRDGYVYLLKQKDFKQVDPVEFVYEKAYIPTHKIPIKKEDFNHKIEIVEK